MNIVVTIQESALSRLSSIAGALRAAGLEDATLLDAIGVITGKVATAAKLEALRRVDGVQSIELAGPDIELPDPESPIQ